jgi:hypothetical protein
MKKVPTIEVKRCFAVSNMVKQPRSGERYLGELTPKEFAERLGKAKKKVRYLRAPQLDRLIVADRYTKRLRAYDSCDWFQTEISAAHLGVWRGAGGLPIAWTNGSLADTAKYVTKALDSGGRELKKRSRHIIPTLLRGPISQLQKEKYLLPIVFMGGTGTNGRRNLKRMKGDIDDGCMRSVALAVRGKKKIKVYFGIPKRNSHVLKK